jgi:hypothetical protein
MATVAGSIDTTVTTDTINTTNTTGTTLKVRYLTDTSSSLVCGLLGKPYSRGPPASTDNC